MAQLSTKERKKLPKSDFGEPGKRAYPMPDKSHAGNAKARASQAVKAGRMSKSEEHKIDRKADRVLGHGKSRESHDRAEHRAKPGHGTEHHEMMKHDSAKEREHRGKEHLKVKEHKMEGHKEGRHHESKKTAERHERKGEEKHMAHEKKDREHERRGMEHKMHERKAEHGKSGEHKHLHFHHWHHTGEK